MKKKEISSENIRKGIKISIGLSLLASLIVIVFTIEEQTWFTLLKVKPVFLIFNILAALIMWIAGGWRLKVVAGALGEKLTLLETTEIFLAGAFMANVTPSASGSGPLLLYLLYKKGIPIGKASTIMFIQTISRLFFFTFLVPVFFFFFSDYIDPGIIPVQIFNLVILASFIISLLTLYFIWKPRLLYSLIKGLYRVPFLNKYLKAGKPKKIMDMILEETENFHLALEQITREKKSVLFYSLGITSIFWFFYFMVPSLTLLGFGEEPHFARSYIMQTIFNIVMPFVPTPGASGIAEFGFLAIFSPFVGKHLVGLVVIAWRFFTFYLPTIIGGLIIVKIFAIHIFNKNNDFNDKNSLYNKKQE